MGFKAHPELAIGSWHSWGPSSGSLCTDRGWGWGIFLLGTIQLFLAYTEIKGSESINQS